jgi:hypothetical protein
VDLAYPVRVITEQIGPIHPKTGVPTEFRIANPYFEIEFFRLREWDFALVNKLDPASWTYQNSRGLYDDGPLFSLLESQRATEGTGKWEWETNDWRPRIIRRDDDTTPDILMFVPIDLDTSWGNAGVWLQPLPDGGCARYYTSASGSVLWVSLWRIEYPDGRIEDVMSRGYDTEKSYSFEYWQKYARQDVEWSRGRNGASAMVGPDRVLLDGTGCVYAILTDRGMVPVCRVPGRYTNGKTPEGLQCNQAGVNLKDDRWTIDAWSKTGKYTNTGPLFDGELAKLVTMAQAPNSAFISLRPADALKLYYSIGGWRAERFYGYKKGDCDYNIPWYDARLAKVSGHKGAILELMIRQRLWVLRPDLTRVRLSDGSEVAGMVDPQLMPPADGQFLQKLGCRFDKITKAVNIAIDVVLAVVPGGWALELGKLGLNAVQTVLQFNEAQRQLGQILELQESGKKFTRLVKDVQTGVMRIVAEDPPTQNEQDLRDRADGKPTTPTTSPSSGSSLILLAGAAAAIIIASR